jgi:hypothetical protein
MSLPVAARFRAIITGPLSGSPGTSDGRQNGYEPYGGARFQDASATKRKKDQDDPGRSIPKKIVRRTSDDEGGSTREVSQNLNMNYEYSIDISRFIANNLIYGSRGIVESFAGSF